MTSKKTEGILSTAIRTRRNVFHFASPFSLPGSEKLQPAGDYQVDHDEESIEGPSWTAWRHVGAFIHLPALGVKSTEHQMVPINSADLKSALNKDLK